MRPSSVLGKWAISSRYCALRAPAQVPAAGDCGQHVAAADGLVVFGGGGGGVTLVAVAESPRSRTWPRLGPTFPA